MKIDHEISWQISFERPTTPILIQPDGWCETCLNAVKKYNEVQSTTPFRQACFLCHKTESTWSCMVLVEYRVQSPEFRLQTNTLITGPKLKESFWAYIVLKDYWGPIAGEVVCLSFDKLLRNWCKGLGICWKKEPNFLPDAKIIGVQLAKRIGSPLHLLHPSRGIKKMTKT